MRIKKWFGMIVFLLTVTLVCSHVNVSAAVFGYNEPTQAWNWVTGGTTYNINGNSTFQTLYTEYYFTNANSYSVNITNANNSSSQMSVKLWKKITNGKTLVDEFIVPIGGTVSKFYRSDTVTYGNKYFLEFSPSAYFSGYISKVF